MNQIRGQFDVQSGSSIDEARVDFYALLGLPPFESNPAKISARARDLMRDARKYQVGPRASEAQVTIERLAMASACLLDPAQKVVYDNDLRERFGLPPISIRSEYVPEESGPAEVPELRHQEGRRLLSPRVALALIVVLAAAAIMIIQQLQHPASSADSIPKAGQRHPGPFQAPLGHPAGKPDSIPSGHPAVGHGSAVTDRSSVAPNSATGENRLPAGMARQSTIQSSVAASTPKRGPDENSHVASPPAIAGTDNGAPPDPSAGVRSEPPPAQNRPGPATAPPMAGSTNVWPPAGQAQSPAPEIQLPSAELLRQLREFRLKRSPAMRMSLNPQMLGAQRVVDLVQYGRKAFSDDRRFQRQLDQEVTALRKLYAPFRDVLPEPEH